MTLCSHKNNGDASAARLEEYSVLSSETSQSKTAAITVGIYRSFKWLHNCGGHPSMPNNTLPIRTPLLEVQSSGPARLFPGTTTKGAHAGLGRRDHNMLCISWRASCGARKMLAELDVVSTRIGMVPVMAFEEIFTSLLNANLWDALNQHWLEQEGQTSCHHACYWWQVHQKHAWQ